MKFLICSSAGVPISGLNFGNHFSGESSNWCSGARILTTPGLLDRFWAIVKIIADDIANEILDIWEGVDIEV